MVIQRFCASGHKGANYFVDGGGNGVVLVGGVDGGEVGVIYPSSIFQISTKTNKRI